MRVGFFSFELGVRGNKDINKKKTAKSSFAVFN